MSVHTYVGYLFSYFIGEGHEDGEQVYFALSEGNDPLKWQELNDGKPVLTSALGEKGVRDPFLIRAENDDKYYLIATDLRIYGNGDWHRAVTKGSRSMIVWESTDLIHWREPWQVEVAPPEAGCTWAPEAIYDESTQEYIVFWASTLLDHEEDYHRMLYARTKDFKHFSEPEIMIDYGYSVIDTTIIKHQENFYRFSKGKHVIQEEGKNLFDTFTCINENIEEDFMVQGEGPIIFKANETDEWYLFIDEYGHRGYLPLVTTDLSTGQWTMPKAFSLPSNPRHGSVLPVTKEEYDRLIKHYQTT